MLSSFPIAIFRNDSRNKNETPLKYFKDLVHDKQLLFQWFDLDVKNNIIFFSS